MLYTSSNIDQIKSIFRNECFHDGKISKYDYDITKGVLELYIENKYCNKGMCLSAINVMLIISTSLKSWKTDNLSIVSCTLEDKKTIINALNKIQPHSIGKVCEIQNNCILFVIQFFSGDELYVMCEKISLNDI